MLAAETLRGLMHVLLELFISLEKESICCCARIEQFVYVMGCLFRI